MNAKERRYFNIADSVAQLSDHPRAKLGCVVINKGKIISSGHNSFTKTHPLQKQLDKRRFNAESTGKVHAETSALLPLINSHTDLSKAEVYVSRKLKDSSIAMARPCASCMALIKSCGISKIHYTTADGYATETLEF